MPAVPKRFIITYLLAFALLWGIGVFVAARQVGEGWATDPFNKRRGGYIGSFDSVYTHIIADDVGSGFRLTTYSDEEYGLMGNDHGLWPEDLPGNLGVVTLVHNYRLFRAGPFLLRSRSRIGIDYHIEDQDSVPLEVLDDARIETIRHAHSTSEDMLYFDESDLPFDTGFTPPNRIWIRGHYEFLMPPWLIITVFAFGPLLAAWTVTAATVRPKPNPA